MYYYVDVVYHKYILELCLITRKIEGVCTNIANLTGPNKLNQTDTKQTNPTNFANLTEPEQTKPNQTEREQTKPNQTYQNEPN